MLCLGLAGDGQHTAHRQHLSISHCGSWGYGQAAPNKGTLCPALGFVGALVDLWVGLGSVLLDAKGWGGLWSSF